MMSQTDSPVRFKMFLLGSWRLENGSGAIHLSTRKIKSLLAYLILHPEEHTREKLAALLWGDSSDTQARGSLRTALKTLRKQVDDDLLVTDPEKVQLNPDLPLWVDTQEFLRDDFPSNIENQSATILRLQSKVTLYRGDLLADYYDEWIFPEREHFRELYLDALRQLAQSARTTGDYACAVEYAHKILAVDPTNEPGHQQLMVTLHATGNRLAALKQYEEFKRLLRAELDTDPSAETTALYLDIKQSVATPRAGAERFTNVPVPLTSFVGRQREVGEIKNILAQQRLVTLTGAGGSGKTRLAIQVATDLSGSFRDGVWWIDMVALNDAALVPQTVALVLGIREVPNELLSDTLAHTLEAKQLLLVFDSCEHLIMASAQLSESLLRGLPNLKVLATSQEPFDIPGESVYQVPTLSLPTTLELPVHQVMEHEATRLFVERALAARADFALDLPNALATVQICQRLDGIPLAIELAAARVKILTPHEITSHLDDRFEFLTAGSRTLLARHQTLRATIDWSYSLLTETETELFRRLSVFADGFTLEAARAVCLTSGIAQAQVLDLLSRLIDKSLIVVAPSHHAIEETRYRLLESIREYTCKKLEEADEAVQVRDLHLDYFVGLAETAESKTFGAESLKYVQRLDQEFDNIRDALDWSIQTHQANTAFRLAAALHYFWAGGPSYIGYNRSSIGHWQGILNRALSLPEGLKRTAGRAKALNAIGFFFWTDISPLDPRPELEDALSIGRELGDNSIIAKSLCNLGLLAGAQGNYAQAHSLLQQGLDLLRAMGPERMTDYLWALIFLGDVALYREDEPAAQGFYEECSTTLREMQDRNFQAYVVRRLGILAGHRGEFETANELCLESLHFNLELGHERAILACIAALAGIALARERNMDAAKLFGAVQVHLNARSSRLPRTDQVEYDRNVSVLRSQLDPATLEKAWTQGGVMTLDEATEYAAA